MTTFTITELANDRVLISGEDRRGVYGEQVLDAGAHFERKRHEATKSAHADFDAALEEFYAPLTAAAQALKSTVEFDIDPLLYVVEQEASEGRAAQDKVVVRLDNASVLIRAIETGQSDRLIWIKDELIVTARDTSVPAVPVEDNYPGVDAPPADEVVIDDVVTGDDQGTTPTF